VSSSTARIIPPSDLFARIGARDPYFALRSVAAFGDGTVEAEVPVELKSRHECGPITAGEAARHLGLLGTCALAEVNPNKSLHYYLPRSATLERSPSAPTSSASKLEGRAEGQLLEDDAGRARCSLHLRGGGTVFTLDVEYSILRASEFQKAFRGVKRDLRTAARPPVDERHATGELRLMRSNPYGAPLGLEAMDLSPGADLIEATFGPVPPEACTGHYPMYPVLPTGIVMTALSQLSGHLLERRRRDQAHLNYIVRHALARADNFAVAGDSVRFEARYLGGSAKNQRFDGKARCGKKPVGAVSLTLALV
jgi:hypothetical protein